MAHGSHIYEAQFGVTDAPFAGDSKVKAHRNAVKISMFVAAQWTG